MSKTVIKAYLLYVYCIILLRIEAKPYIQNMDLSNSTISYVSPNIGFKKMTATLGRNETFGEECKKIPKTVILNHELIVEFKYAYFHHDEEDVQQNAQYFVEYGQQNPIPIPLCHGNACRNFKST